MARYPENKKEIITYCNKISLQAYKWPYKYGES